MVRILLATIALLAILVGLLYSNRITKKHFYTLLILLSIFGAISIYIEHQNNIYRDFVVRLKMEFEQEKNISCGEYVVNMSYFNLTSNSFVAKEKSPYRGAIIPFEKCRLEKQER